MREIKFRGRRVDNGEWVEGSLITKINPKEVEPVFWATLIHDGALTAVEVDPATVGQFTGLLDKNGREIYEFDVITGWTSAKEIVKYNDKKARFEPNWIQLWNVELRDEKIEVIGDIHENPELIA